MTYQNPKIQKQIDNINIELEDIKASLLKKTDELEVEKFNTSKHEFMKHHHAGGDYKRINAKDLTGGIKAERVGIVNDSICLKIGDYYLWIDSTGDLRIKSSEPTTDTDGIVIGTQT